MTHLLYHFVFVKLIAQYNDTVVVNVIVKVTT